ncbi:MAG: glycosyltransferase [Bacteroidota bacterium]|nr:glycosyltransferase [Bacteroidota bacterium]
MKKILFLTYVNPYTLLAGDRIYTVNILKSLIDFGYSIDLLYYNSEPSQPLIPEQQSKFFNRHLALDFNRKSNLKLVFSCYPGMVTSRRTSSYLKQIRDWTRNKKYDVAIINHLRMGFCLEALPSSVKKIYVSHNAEYLLSLNNYRNESNGIKKLVYAWDAMRTRLYEQKLLKNINGYTAICENDLRYLKGIKMVSSALLRPVLNGAEGKLNSKEDFFENIKKMIVVGSFTWGPKAQNIKALVRSFVENQMVSEGFELHVVGRIEDHLAIQLKRICPDIYITGQVVNLEKFYSKCSIALIPEIMGGGFKLKVAEAGMFKKAIFSVQGAITKSNLKPQSHFNESKDLDELMLNLIESVKNPEELWRMAVSAHEVVNTEYTQEALSKSLKRILT